MDVVDEIVHNITLKVLLGLQSGHFQNSGQSFRAILYQSAIFSTRDYFKALKRDQLICSASSWSTSEDEGFNPLEQYADPKSEEETEEVCFDWCIEALIPILMVNEQILASIKAKTAPKDRMKEAEKLISIAILPTMIYLDFNHAKTSMGKESKVSKPPKIIQNLVGFNDDYKTRKLDNLKNRQLPEKLDESKAEMMSGDSSRINHRIELYRKHLQKAITPDILLDILGSSAMENISKVEELPADFLVFVHKLRTEIMQMDLNNWARKYAAELSVLCNNSPERLFRIFDIDDDRPS